MSNELNNTTSDDEPNVRTRPDVWKLSVWDDTLLWYSRAVREMLSRPLNDPTSWRYQAAIHEYRRAGDPYAIDNEALPSLAQQRRFWSQCQHSSWYFLPWHRMYLGYFERIVGSVIVELGGPPNWTLPYWNYSDSTNGDARKIPPAFREEFLPDGTPNSLRVEERSPSANPGGEVATAGHVVLSCLLADVFAGPTPSNPGFGGPRTVFSHSGGTNGFLENVPHGSIHGRVGGTPPSPVGFMSRFNTAGLDPLFWLHHANIDRIWSVWNNMDPGNINPTESAWLNEPAFEFHDENRNEVTMTCGEVTDTQTSPFQYRYEDVSNPLGGQMDGNMDIEDDDSTTETETIPAEMLGATESRTVLDGRAVTTSIHLEVPTGPAADVEESDASVSPRTFLFIENVVGVAPVPHQVYVDLPEGANPKDHPDKLVGSLSMFGLPEASGEDPQHPGSGLNFSLDVTSVVENPDEVRVTLVPEDVAEFEADPAVEGDEQPVPVIEIGRISVYRGG